MAVIPPNKRRIRDLEDTVVTSTDGITRKIAGPMTQLEYDSLTPDADTLYLIVD